jgi:subtilisin family serine protease
LKGVVQALQAAANATQGAHLRRLEVLRAQGQVSDYAPLWVLNGFSVTASAAAIHELALDPDVLKITPDEINIVPAAGVPEPNLSVINAPAVWSKGFYGQGVVVANLDSGVDVTHPDLAGRWRGGTDSWFDPYGQHPTTPTDLSGHGTWTMGVMVGGDAGGSSIGAAPGAKWIAAKIFNDQGASTASAIHQSFQWLLDPDGNPNTADAPQVVNNSWSFGSPGCYLDFEPDLQALRAAGILPVFAAGNGGPYSTSSYSPANNPSAFAVGAVNNAGQIYAYSSRGPSTCSGSTGPFPDLVAPGVNIRSVDLLGGYSSSSGTSLAAPHVSGALALLLSAYPNTAAADQERALMNTAVDLGAVGPDDSFGYGLLDTLAAYNWLAAVPAATVTLPPLPTATAAPTATATATLAPITPATAVPTATATPLPASLHIGDLDRSSALSGTTKWNATVTIRVHNNYEQAVANATVSGAWSSGASGSATCTTNSSGICTVSKTGVSIKTTSVTFTVRSVVLAPFTYKAAANHDPDADSNGSVIVVTR